MNKFEYYQKLTRAPNKAQRDISNLEIQQKKYEKEFPLSKRMIATGWTNQLPEVRA